MNKKKVVVIIIGIILFIIGLFVEMYFIEKIDFNELDNKVNNMIEKEKIEYPELEKLTKYENGVSTQIIVKYNDVLYGESSAKIDYAPNNSEPLGSIDKLIDSKYVPMQNCETNTQELLGALVESVSEKLIVLFYNNEYVLFEKLYEIIGENNKLIGISTGMSKMLKLEEIPLEYAIEDAKKDGYFIVTNSSVYFKSSWLEFLENVKNKKTATIRMVKSTIEGGIIIDEIVYDGNNTFTIATDTRRDKYGFGTIQYYTYTGEIIYQIISKKLPPQIIYKIVGDEDDFILCSYTTTEGK